MILLTWDEEKAHVEKRTQLFIWTTEDRSVHVQSWSDDETKVLTETLRSSSLESAVETLLLNYEPEKLTVILTENLSTWVNAGLFEIIADS